MSIPPSNIPANDIPPARRQAAIEVKPAIKRSHSWWKMALSLLILAGAGTVGVWQWDRLSAQAAGIKAAIAEGNLPLPRWDNFSQGKLRQGSDSQRSRPAANAEQDSAGSTVGSIPPEQLLNHRHYEEVPPEALVSLNSKSAIKLQPAAQASINAMIAQAKADGVKLGIISGFRSLEDQNYLFFDVKKERGETSQTRAEVSAPPGYSEHHTGYAVDFIDESQPQTELEESFETTPAYRWLQKNAAFYNFEMSFPQDPSSPVGYEPWHWRYVGDQQSLELFYGDQSIRQPASN